MPNSELLSIPSLSSHPSTKDHLPTIPPFDLSIPLTFPTSITPVSVPEITNDAFSHRHESLDEAFSSKCGIPETSLQKAQTGVSRHVSIKPRSLMKMKFATGKSSTCSDVEREVVASKTDERYDEVLYQANNRNTANLNAECLHYKFVSRSVPIFTPGGKGLQPGHVANGGHVINSSATTRTQLPHTSVGESDMKGATRRSRHGGLSHPDSHQPDITFDKVPISPEVVLAGKAPSYFTMSKKPPMPKSLSADRLPSLRYMHSPDSAPRAFRPTSSKRPESMGTQSTRKKDELSSAFRSLDGEFRK